MKTRKIGLANYLAYGSGDFLGAGTTALTAAWLLYFYTTFCGLTPIEATFIFAAARVLDACDVVVPVNQIAPYLTFVKSLEEKYDFTIKSFGHAGDGNLHIYACANDMDEAEFKKQVADFMDIIYKKAAECGGLISGEHGIGYGKMDYLAAFAGETSMRLMKGIKEVFDPKMILNPGKVCYSL